MTEETIGRNDRLKFYVACFWTDELGFHYYRVKSNNRRRWSQRRRKDIMLKARQMGAF